MSMKRLTSLILIMIAIAAAAGAGGYLLARNGSAAEIQPSGYYAVLLSNGAVYFGTLEGFDTPNPVLRDVYYVQSTVDQQTKAVNSVLIKRGKEWHAPDRMILERRNILFIEPVGRGSRVAQLIAEAKEQ